MIAVFGACEVDARYVFGVRMFLISKFMINYASFMGRS